MEDPPITSKCLNQRVFKGVPDYAPSVIKLEPDKGEKIKNQQVTRFSEGWGENGLNQEHRYGLVTDWVLLGKRSLYF